MWLENKKYREIRTALHSGAQSALDRVFHEIPADEKGSVQAPVRCPVCHKDLKRGPLPYLEFFGAACPDFHGWWLSPEISKKLRDFIGEQISAGVKKARQFKRLIIFLMALGGLAFLNTLLSLTQQPHPQTSGAASSFVASLPEQSKAVPPGEWAYLVKVTSLLEKAAANRTALEDSKSFSPYRISQKALMEKLTALDVPQTLLDFNRGVLKAFENQIIFYATLTQGTEGKGVRAPALKTLHEEVAAAYDLLIRLYPDLDPPTRMALQERLFALEPV